MRAYARDPLVFTTKGTEKYEAMRRRHYHEGPRRNTKPCGGGFNVDVW